MRVICTDAEEATWKAARWNAVTASRLPTLVGLVPYEKRPHEEVLRAYAMREEIDSSPAMEAGTRFQDIVMAWAMELHPSLAGAVKSGELVVRDDTPWLMASLDWKLPDGTPVECKCHSPFSSKDWKAGPPQYVQAQVQSQAYITEAQRVPVVEWCWGMLPTVHVVEADAISQAALVSEAKRLWNEIEALRRENGDL